MRVSVNLASRPYVELGPLYMRLRILIVALALIALPLWLLLRSETKKAAQAHARLAAVEQATQALERQQQSFQSEMRQPQNAAVLEQAQFLNGLFARKAFSWTAVMMDLENVLPTGVQVLNIDPVIARDGDVTIRLRVSGQRDRAVDLVRNLEHSRRFLAPRLAAETAETTTQGGRDFEQVSSQNNVNFDILAEYNPLPAEAAPQKAAKDAAKSTTAAGSHSALPHPAAKSPKGERESSSARSPQGRHTMSPTMNATRTKFLSVLNLHFLGLGLLVLLNLILGVRLFAAWHTLRASGAEQIEQAQARYRTLELRNASFARTSREGHRNAQAGRAVL